MTKAVITIANQHIAASAANRLPNHLLKKQPKEMFVKPSRGTHDKVHQSPDNNYYLFFEVIERSGASFLQGYITFANDRLATLL
jgi:hypothetical protein